jgi:hypothetical protein
MARAIATASADFPVAVGPTIAIRGGTCTIPKPYWLDRVASGASPKGRAQEYWLDRVASGASPKRHAHILARGVNDRLMVADDVHNMDAVTPEHKTHTKRSIPNPFSAMVVAVSAVVVSLYVRSAMSPKGLFAGDLPAYLVGWRLAKSNPSNLYDLTTQRLMAGSVMDRPGSVPACPFNYPPHFALLGRIIPPLRYNAVVVPWVLGSVVVSLLGIYWWICFTPNNEDRSLRSHGLRNPNVWQMMAVAAAVPASITAVLSGSIFPVVVIGLMMVLAALTGKQPVKWSAKSTIAIGSFGWMLLAIKPHLALIVGLVGLILATRKTIVTAAWSIPALVIAPTALLGSSVWGSWVGFLRQFSESTSEDLLCRIPLAAPNIEGTAARFGIATSSASIWSLYLFALLAICAWVARCRPSLTTAVAVAAAIIPLTAPHANPQDLALCLPFVLVSLFGRLSGSTVQRAILMVICVVLMISRWDRFMYEIQILVVGLLAVGLFNLIPARNRSPVPRNQFV